jgi:hypothetical protein
VFINMRKYLWYFIVFFCGVIYDLTNVFHNNVSNVLWNG